MSKNTQCVCLNENGVKALRHLAELYVRDGNILDCHEIKIDQPRYLEAKLRPQRDYPEEMMEASLAHVLVPHEFVSLIVLDEPNIPVGFGPE